MTFNVVHPAMYQLLRLQSRGRVRRMARRFAQPRRLALSAVACALAVLWLGNAAMTVWLREAGSPDTLRALLSWGLVLYSLWHVAKAAFFRPENPFDWPPAECDLLAAMPLRPRDLVGRQLASVTATTLVKAGLMTLLLLPDLRCVPLGLTGVLLAFLSLELLRMTCDIASWGMGRAMFRTCRAAVVAGLAAGAVAVAALLARENAFARINPGEGLVDRLLGIVVQLNAAPISYAALPFQPVIDLILAERISATNLGIAAGAIAALSALAAAVIGLYAVTVRRVANRERRSYPPRRATRDRSARPSRRKQQQASVAASRPSLRRVPRWGGAGPLAWRQLVGARRRWGSLLTAMIAPAVLAGIPCFVIADPFISFLSTAGALAFYTFLLLPTALRFDFRRDLDRMAVLKGLPITPAAVAIGQTAAPVLMATLFQAAVLAFALVARGLPPHLFVAVMAIMIPLNMLVFGLDNLIYLLYPYRMQQEGLEIFLRTMLAFTGKGLLFTLGLVAMSAWGFAAAALARGLGEWTGRQVDAYAVFAAGMISGPSALAAIVTWSLSRTFRNMDSIEDIPR
jgi:hypothetical protein